MGNRRFRRHYCSTVSPEDLKPPTPIGYVSRARIGRGGVNIHIYSFGESRHANKDI